MCEYGSNQYFNSLVGLVESDYVNNFFEADIWVL